MNLPLDTRIVLVICYFIQGFAALRLLKVSIPSYKLRGESVFLECQYELDKVRDIGWGDENSHSVSNFGHIIEHENSFADSNDEHDDEEEKERDDEREEGESLYAIKWYKDNEEFYRYVPKAKPPKTSYRVDGVRVIEEHSDNSKVLLRGLTINSTGLYRCEISAEAPNFSSVEAEGHMDVVYLPRDGPYIRGQQSQYQIGETLELNCTSGKSHPASHLQWFINDEAVLEKLNLIKYNDTIHRHGLITSTLGLEKIVEARHFHKGAMRVKCVASLSPVLWKSDKESVLQRRRPGLIDNREAMLLVHSSAGKHYKIDDSLALFIVLTLMAFSGEFHQFLLLQRTLL
uniref:Ig-like domain-containing protein n=1 Tax=Glossina brevipalpis TaxID=37001 RepID=A0A1A9WYS0_9MUSC